MKRKAKSATFKDVGGFDITVPKSKREKSDATTSLIERAIAKRGLRSAIKRHLRDAVAAYINEALGNAPRKRRKSKRKSK